MQQHQSEGSSFQDDLEMDQAFQKLLWYVPRNLLAFLLKKLFMAIYGTCTTDPFYSFTFERWWWSWEVVVRFGVPLFSWEKKKKLL